jgi:MFS family permease
VWHESVLTAGLMIAPGPLMAATFSVVGGRFADRAGHRTLAVIGGLVFALGSLFWALRMGAHPNYAGAFLPGFIIGGIGVGLVNPTLSSAAAAALPAGRFATGSAIYNMSRQLGSALGVALLVAIVGTPTRAGAVGAFRGGVLIVVAGGALTAIAAAAMGRVRIGAVPVAAATPEPLRAAA